MTQESTLTQRVSSVRAISLTILGAVIAIGIGSYLLLLPASEKAAAANPQASPLQTVETIRPIRADIARSFNTNGTLEAFETADLYPKVSGYLSDVRVDIGDRVKAGQVLAVISLPETEKELAEAEATVASKRANLALQQITLQRQTNLLKIQGTAQQAYDEAKGNASVAAAEVDLAVATAAKIRTMLDYTRILAPFDGVVAQRQVNRGDFLQAASSGRTTPLFTVQRVDVIRVFCNVPESDVARLRVGLRANVKPYGLEGKPIAGKVTRFAGRLDPETRNMRTEIDVPNPGGRLYPGMYAQVSLETELHQNALTLPVSSVGTDPNGRFVYTAQQGRIVRQPVQVGMAEGGMVEVLSGVSDNTDVTMVVQGAPPPGTIVKTVPHA
jgi:RND family efflux transporter MFP subunit